MSAVERKLDVIANKRKIGFSAVRLSKSLQKLIQFGYILFTGSTVLKS